MNRQLAIRLPLPLNEWITQQAELNQRSLNRQMVLLLEQSHLADKLATRCFGNMHLFKDGNVCNCGKVVKI